MPAPRPHRDRAGTPSVSLRDRLAPSSSFDWRRGGNRPRLPGKRDQEAEQQDSVVKWSTSEDWIIMIHRRLPGAFLCFDRTTGRIHPIGFDAEKKPAGRRQMKQFAAR